MNLTFQDLHSAVSLILDRFALSRKLLHIREHYIYHVHIQYLDIQGILGDRITVAPIEEKVDSSHTINLIVIQWLSADLRTQELSVLVRHTSYTADNLPILSGHLLQNHPDIRALELQVTKFVCEREHRNDIIQENVSLRHIHSDSAEIGKSHIHFLACQLAATTDQDIDKPV